MYLLELWVDMFSDIENVGQSETSRSVHTFSFQIFSLSLSLFLFLPFPLKINLIL